MDSPSRIVVTATGIVSALGSGIDAQVAALRMGTSGLRYPQLLETKHRDYPIGEVVESNDTMRAQLGLEHGDHPRTSLLALAAMRDLVQQCGADRLKQERVALINAGTVGGMGTVENFYMDFIEPGKTGDFARHADCLSCANSTQDIARYFGMRPVYQGTLSTACSSSANAMIMGARLLRLGMADAAICGGVDSMSRFTLNGFLSLKNLDRDPCKPFDQNRNGLNLGEGAAYLMLEREEDALARGATILAVLSGWANGNDTYHPTAPSPEGIGAAMTMQAALDKANLAPEAIDYINAHGTATHANDLAEGRAIERVFGAGACFSSTKPFTGHTLAAAGAIEAVLALGCMVEGFAPANQNFSEGMEEISARPIATNQQKDLRHVISNSFGFGGSNVSLVFSKP